jgi:hypothetical protein
VKGGGGLRCGLHHFLSGRGGGGWGGGGRGEERVLKQSCGRRARRRVSILFLDCEGAEGVPRKAEGDEVLEGGAEGLGDRGGGVARGD